MIHRKVLLIHDSQETLDLLKGFMMSEFEDIIIMEADSTSSAVRLLEEHNFNVIIANSILPNIKDLKEKGTQFILMISSESEQQLEQLKEHDIQYYITLPLSPSKLRDKINEVYNPEELKSKNRYSVSDVEAVIHLRNNDCKVKVVEFGPNSLLCEVDVRENYDELLKNVYISIEFPTEYENVTINRIYCKHVFIKVIGWSSRQKPEKIQIVWSFLEMREEFRKNLLKAVKIAETKRNKIVSWQKNRLEIQIGRSIYLFYKIQLFRLGTVCLVLTVLLFLLISSLFSVLEKGEDVDVVWQSGNVFYQKGVNDWEIIDESKAPAKYQFYVGDIKKETPVDKKLQLADLGKEYAVFRYSPYETILLSKGSQIRRTKDGRIVNYKINGVAHLIVDKTETAELHQISINNVYFQTTEAHVFYQEITSNGEISVNNGNLTLSPQKTKFIIAPAKVKIVSGQIVVSENDLIKVMNNQIKFEKRNRAHDNVFFKTHFPGFNTKGPFYHVGNGILNSGRCQLLRGGKHFDVNIENLPLMSGDKIINNSKERILLEFFNGDQVLVYPDGEFLVGRVQGNEKSEDTKKPVKYQLQGRARTDVKKRSDNQKSLFEVNVGMIKSAGGEFEINTSPSSVEVLSVSGTSVLSNQKGETATIERGMVSRLEKGQSPSKPIPILEEKLIELLKESVVQGNGIQLASFSTVTLKDLALNDVKTVSLYWTQPVQAASILLGEEKHPLNISMEGMAASLDRKMFPRQRAGKYPVKIALIDKNGADHTLDATLHLLTDTDPDILCGVISRELRWGYRAEVSKFQERMNIHVDGIIGSETRGKINEIKKCRAMLKRK